MNKENHKQLLDRVYIYTKDILTVQAICTNEKDAKIFNYEIIEQLVGEYICEDIVYVIENVRTYIWEEKRNNIYIIPPEDICKYDVGNNHYDEILEQIVCEYLCEDNIYIF